MPGSRIHGHAKSGSKMASPTYKTWDGMIQRCTNPTNRSFRRYGGRGVTVCKRWRKFSNFLLDMGIRPAGRSLGRKDNDGGYNLQNCRWETPLQQCNNRRTNHFLSWNGETKSLAAWAREWKLNRATLRSRLLNGWSVERIMSEEIQRRSKDERDLGEII